jgi:hypothetical protein
MSDDLEEVLERQKNRYKILYGIYKSVAGKKNYHRCYVEVPELIEAMGMNDEDVYEALDYLVEEGLLLSISDELFIISLSHRGKVEVERSITHPNESTEHFMVSVVQHFHAPVGVVQSGSHSTAGVTQYFSFDTSEMLELVIKLRQNIDNLTPEKRAEATELVEGLEEEASAPDPRPARIKAFVRELSTLSTSSSMEVILSGIFRSLGM